jgi:hypothetical protein
MRHYKSLQRAPRFRHLLAIGIFVAAMTAAICGSFILSNVQVQLLPPQRKPFKGPSVFGQYLLAEMRDFRLHCVSESELDDKRRRGVISFCTQFAGEGCSEYPVVHYRTVEDVLQTTTSLRRKRRTPQIRVIQKDSIFQSSIDDTNTVTGFSPQFLQLKLNAGDIIVVSPLYD